MKKLLTGAILLFSISLSYAEEVDPNIALIQNSFEAYLKDFIARDAAGLATHFQFPSINALFERYCDESIFMWSSDSRQFNVGRIIICNRE